MGFAKRLLEEQQESGFYTTRYFDAACEHCVGDDALRLFVSRHGVIDICDFCSRQDVHGMRLGDLFAYMASCIRAEWDDPLNEVNRPGFGRGSV